ncbi:MAG: hypothetical protein K8I00_07725, partial [Candidatus Omnitrophica bacterium]|nr:hypothetical protein [Candidatus Omnitrophota bacterium]
MKRTNIPGTTTRFFGIVLLLICTAGLSHYSQIFQRHQDVAQFQQRHLQQHLQNIRGLHQIFKNDRNQLMDARIKAPVFVNYSDQASVQAIRNLQDYYLAEYKNSLIALACLLESASNRKFACEDFS